jgi:hypothetical protein
MHLKPEQFDDTIKTSNTFDAQSARSMTQIPAFQSPELTASILSIQAKTATCPPRFAPILYAGLLRAAIHGAVLLLGA